MLLIQDFYQPLTFTPKIIFTNPQTQAVLTISSQIVATQDFVTQEVSSHINNNSAHSALFEEKINKNGTTDIEALLKYASTLDPTDENHIPNKKYTDNSIKSAITGIKTPACVNEGSVDTSENPTLILKVSNTSVNILATAAKYVCTYSDRISETVNTDFTISNNINEGLNNFIKIKDSNPVAINSPQVGKDIWVDFRRGDATDNYQLHTPTVIGSPSFTGNKFNSNGNTGISYPVAPLGTGAWCIVGKFKSTSATVMQTLYCQVGTYPFQLFKTTANKLQLYLSSNNTAYNISNAILGTKSDWGTTTEYWIKTYFTGSAYKVDWSTDSTNGIDGTWTNDITVTSSVSVYQNTSAIYFGIYNTTQYPLLGTIGVIRVLIGGSAIFQKYIIATDNVYPTSAKYFDGCYITHIGVEPIKTYKMVSGTAIETQFVKLGYAIVAAGIMATPITNPYNQNGYDINVKSSTNLMVIDFTKGISKAWNTEHIAFVDGWVRVSVGCRYGGAGYLLIEGNSVFYVVCDNANVTNYGMYFVGKGQTYKGAGGEYNQSLTFYPSKGGY